MGWVVDGGGVVVRFMGWVGGWRVHGLSGGGVVGWKVHGVVVCVVVWVMWDGWLKGS